MRGHQGTHLAPKYKGDMAGSGETASEYPEAPPYTRYYS